MTTIGYNNIEDVLLNLTDPNTGGAISEVPGVNCPKIDAGTSVYNIQAEGGEGIAGWSTSVQRSSSDYDTVAWSSGDIYMPDGTQYAVSSGNTGNMSGMTYIYYDMTTNTVSTTTQASQSVGENKLILCVAKPTVSGKSAQFQAFGTGYESTFITADNIAANTITGNEIAANTITANEMNVSQLSAISANLGTINAGTITGTSITAGNTASAAIELDPSTSGKIKIYHSATQVGTITGQTVTGLGNAVVVDTTYLGLFGTVLIPNKLRIPVGTDLY